MYLLKHILLEQKRSLTWFMGGTKTRQRNGSFSNSAPVCFNEEYFSICSHHDSTTALRYGGYLSIAFMEPCSKGKILGGVIVLFLEWGPFVMSVMFVLQELAVCFLTSQHNCFMNTCCHFLGGEIIFFFFVFLLCAIIFNFINQR